MKLLFTTLFLLNLTVITYSQTDSVKTLIDNGIHLHDQGQYKQAITKYKEALKIDRNNVTASYEMAFSYLSLKNYTETERLCQEIINKNPKSKTLKNVYTTYANSLDQRGKSKEALTIYDKAIEMFPDYYMLYFNKGITSYGLKDNAVAQNSFKKSAQLNPNHSSSFFYLGIVEDNMGNRISSILALSRFLILAPKGERAKQILPHLTKKVNNLHSYIKNDNSTSTVSTAKKRTDTAASEFKEVEENLGLLAVVSSIPGIDDKEKTVLEEFETHMQTIFELLNAYKKDKTGFYWEFLSPFFIELEKNKFTETFVYDINSYENDDKTVDKWFKKNQKKYDKYIDWVNNYKFEI